MSTIRSFEDLRAWQLARALNAAIYNVTARDEFTDNDDLRDQMRRASVSISSNIAEGFERNGRKEFLNFLSIAKASAGELRSQLFLANDVGLIDEDEFKDLCATARLVSKMIWSLMDYLRTSETAGMKFKNM